MGAGVQSTSSRSTCTPAAAAAQRERPRAGGQRQRRRAPAAARDAHAAAVARPASPCSAARVRGCADASAPGARDLRLRARRRSRPQRLALDPLRRRRQQGRGQRQCDHRLLQARDRPAARVDDPGAPGADRERGREPADARDVASGARSPARSSHTSPRRVSSTSTPSRVTASAPGAPPTAIGAPSRRPVRAESRRHGAVAAVGDPDRPVPDRDVLRVAADRRSGGRSRRPRAGRSARPCRRPR